MSNVVRIELPADATASAKPGPLQDVAANVEAQQSKDSTERPAWLPEQFKTPEELAKSYAELRKKLSEGPGKSDPKEKTPGSKESQKETPSDKKEGQQEEKPADNTADDAAFKPFYEEFAKDGKLSEESYKKLAEEHKLSKAVVDSFIADRLARQQMETSQAEAKVYESVGGQENYTEMANWARENLDAAAIEAFNNTLEGGDIAAIQLAVAGIYQKFSEAEGRPGTRIRGGGGGSNVTPFKNTTEVTKAMSDPRYSTDADYRKEVEARLAVSKVF